MSRHSFRRSARPVVSQAAVPTFHQTPLARATRHVLATRRHPLLNLLGATVLGSLISGQAWANPAGGHVVAGQASIVQATPDTLNIVQSSNKAIINWQSFSIGAGETVNFQQPGAKSVTLNRVTGNDPSAIFGSLNANGTVMLVNPNGVVFGAGSRVDVGGLVATTADINDADFMAGDYRFSQASANQDARVVNQGDISIRDAGLAALVAPGVENSGVIRARLGKVALGGAQTFTLDFQGDGLLSFDASSVVTQVPPGADGEALVINSGQISADGGSIELSARAVQDVVNNVINTNGVIAANSVGSQNGRIVLSGGDGAVRIAGDVSAVGASAGESGGSVAVTGHDVTVASGATIDTSGQAGGGRIALGSDGSEGAAWAEGSVTLEKGATLKADASAKGDGGQVTLLSKRDTRFEGDISAKGGAAGGNGGFVEVSSREVVVLSGDVDLSAAQGKDGELLIDPATLNITDSDSAVNSGNLVSRGWLESQAANASITLEADGLITIEQMANQLIDLQTGLGNSFTLRSLQSDGIVFADSATEIRTQGGAITLEALGTASTLSNIGKLTSNGGDITLTSNSGIGLGNALDAGTGAISVQSIAASISSLSDAAVLSGGKVSLLAAGGNLGNAENVLRTATAALVLHSGGHLNVANSGVLDSLSISSRHILPNASNTYALSSDGLDFALTDGDAYGLQRVVQDGLDFSFSGDRSLLLGHLDVGSGELTLISSNGSLLAGDGNLLRAAALDLSATAAIGTSDSPLQTESAAIQASALGGGLYLNNSGALALSARANGNVAVSSSGTLALKSLSASNRVVALTASSGDIITDSGVLLDAGSLNLNAAGAIGSVVNRLLANATTFTANAGVGGVYASLSGSSSYLDVTSGNGAIDLKTAGSTNARLLSATSTAANGISLEVASGNLILGDINAGSVADVLLRLLGSGAVNSSSGTRIVGRRVTLDSGSSNNININTGAGLIDVQGYGSVYVNQSGDVAVERLLSANGSVYLVNASGDTTLSDVSARSGVSLIAQDGSIFTDGAADSNIVTATGNIALDASRHLGTAAARLSTTAQSLNLSSGGDIYIDNQANLSSLVIANSHASPGQANVIEIDSPYQDFAISDDGSRYLLSNLDSALLGTFSFTGDQTLVLGQVRAGTSSNVTLRASAGDILDDGDAQTRVTGSSVTLRADAGSLGDASHALNVNTSSLALSTAGNLYLNGIADLYSLNISARHGVADALYTYRLTAPSLVLNLTDGADGYHFNTLTDITSLSFTFNGDRDLHLGDIDLTRTGSLILTSNGSILDDGDAATRVLAGSQYFYANGGSIGGATPLALMAQSIYALAGSGDVNLRLEMPVNSSINQTSFQAYASGDVKLLAEQGDLLLRDINASGAIVLTATNGAMSYSSGALRGASITLDAKGALGSAGSLLRLNSSGLVSARSETGDIALNNLSSTFLLGEIAAASGSADLYLTGSGQLLDDGDSATRLRGAAITLNANGTLGNAGTALGLQTSKLTASANGLMNLDNQGSLGDLSLTGKGAAASISLLDGNIGRFLLGENAGAYYLQDISANTALNFAFTASVVGIRIGRIDTAGGSVSLTSNYGSLVTDGGDNGAHILAQSVALKAANGSIGASGEHNALLLSGTTDLALEAAGNFHVGSDTALSRLALVVNASGATANQFAIGAAGQTFAISDDGAYTHTLGDISGSGLLDFSFSGRKNIAVGSIAASGSVSLSSSGGSRNAISQLGDGDGITAAAVSLTANNTSVDATYSRIGTADAALKVNTSDLTVNSISSFNIVNSGALGRLALTLRHNSSASGSPVYTYGLTSSGLAFNVSDSVTATTLSNVSRTGLDFSLNSDRDIAVGTVNTGSRSNGSVSLTAGGSYNSSTGMLPRIIGGTIISGSVSLSAVNYQGSIATNTVTNNLALNSAGNVTVGNSGNLDSLSLTANINNSVSSANYNITAGNITSNSISYSSGSVYGLLLGNFVASNLALTVNTGHALSVGTVNTGTGGSVSLTSGGSILGQNSSTSRITAGEVTLNASTVGIYANTSPLLLTTSRLSGNVSGYLHVSNTGNLTLGDLTLGSGRILNSASILYDGAAIEAASLELNASNGSIGSAGAHLQLDVRNLTLASGYDIYVDGVSDFYSLNVTSTHAQAGRTNTLWLSAPQLVFDIVDDSANNRFVLTEVSDASGLDFSFSADSSIDVARVDAQRGRNIWLSASGSLTSNGAQLNADMVSLSATSAIGSDQAAFTTHALDLRVSAGTDIYVDNSLDLSALSFTNSQSGNLGASYRITSGAAFGSSTATLTFVASDDGSDTYLDTVTDSTGINFTGQGHWHDLLLGTLDTSPSGVANGGQLILINVNGDILAKDASSHLSAASLSFISYNAASIGASGAALSFSAPRLSLDVTGDHYLASDVHLDELTVNTQRQATNRVSTYQLTAPGLTYSAVDATTGTTLNISDDQGLRLTYNSGRSLVLGEIDLGKTSVLNLTTNNAGANIVGDGDANNGITTGSLNLRAQGAIGAAGQPVRADAAYASATAYGGGVRLALSNPAALGGVTAYGDTYLENSVGDIALGSINLNGNRLFVTNSGGSIVSGNLSNVTAVSLDAEGSIGNVSAITTTAYGAGTTVLSATARSNARGATGSIALNESYNLTASDVRAPGGVTLNAGRALSVGTVYGGATGVSLSASLGNITGISGNLVSGGSVALSANYISGSTAYSIGTSSARINVATPILVLTSPKDIYVTDSQALDSLAISRASSSYTAGGVISVQASGLTASLSDSAITNLSNSGRDLDFTFNGNRALSIGTLNAGGGAVTLNVSGYQQDGSITGTSTSLITAGSLNLRSSRYYSGGYTAGSIGTSSQALRTAVGTLIASAPGLVNLYNQGSVKLDNLSAGGDLSVVTGNAGDITLGSLTYGTNSTLSLKAAGSILAGSGSLSSNAGAIILEAVEGIGSRGAAVSIASGSNPLTARVTGTSGDIYLSSNNLSGGLDAQTNGGDISVDASGSLLLTRMISNGGDISVSSSGILNANELNAGSGNVALSASNILAVDATSAIRGQAIDIASANSVGSSSLGLNTIGQNVTVSSAGGDIYLSPSEASTLAVVTSNGGDIVVRAASGLFLGNILSAGGDIDASALGALYAGNINAGSGNVSLSGDTLRADDGQTSLIIGSRVALNAVHGIGDASRALLTHTGYLDAQVSGTGGIYLSDSNTAGLRLNDILTQDGAIDIRAAGPLVAASVVSSSDAAGNDIRLQNASGDLLLGSLSAGDQHGQVVLLSAGAVGRLSADATNVRAHSLSISANGDIGSVTDVLDDASVDALRTRVAVLSLLDTGSEGSQVAIANNGDLSIANGSLRVPATGKVYLSSSASLDARQLLAPAGGDLALLAGTTLYLPQAGLATTGNLRLEGQGDVLSDGATPRRLLASAGTLRLLTGSLGGDTTLDSQAGSLSVISLNNDLAIDNQGELSALSVSGTGNIDFSNDQGFIANSVATSGTGKTLRLTAEDGDLTVVGALQGNDLSVVLNAGNGDITLQQVASGLASLTIAAQNITLVGASSTGEQHYTGTTRLSGSYLTAGGDLTVQGAAQLLGDVDIGTAGGDVSLQAVDGNHALTIANGNGTVSFNGDVGATDALASLSITGSGNLLLGGVVTTIGAQLYRNVSLQGDSTLTSRKSGVTFDGLVDGGHDLLVVSEDAGDVRFLGQVGSLARVGAIRIETAGESHIGATVRAASVYTDDPGSVSVSANIDTTGSQYYGERLSLGSDVQLSASQVTLAAGADGAHGLSIVGDLVLDGPLGEDSPLDSLTVSGSAQLNGGTLATTGDQTYRGAVTLAGDTVLTTTGGSVGFDSTLDGGHDLRIDSAAGDVTFSGNVGDSERLGALNVNSSGTSHFGASLKAAALETDAGGVLEIAAGPIDTTGVQRYGEHLVLSTDTVLKASEVILLAGVDATTEGGQSLTIEGDASLGVVGANDALSSLSVSGSSNVKGGVATTGAQYYSQTLVIDQDTVLKASSVTLSQGVGGVVAGAQSLLIEGSAVIGGEQGDSAPLASLTVLGDTTFNGGSLVTTGDQSYQGAVSLSGDQGLTSEGGSLLFGSSIDSADRSSLALNAGASIEVVGAVGGTSPLGDLLLSAGDSIDFAGNVHVSTVQQAAAGGLTRFGGALLADGADGIVLSGDGFLFEGLVTAENGALTLHNSDDEGAITFNGAILAKDDFTQTGGAHIYLPESITILDGGIELAIVADILSAQAVFTTTGDIVMPGLYAPDTWLTLASGTGALNIGTTWGNTGNRELLQVARLTVPSAGSARLFGSIGGETGRRVARNIDSALKRAPYFINEAPWGGDDYIPQVVASTVPGSVVSTTPRAGSLFDRKVEPEGLAREALGAYRAPEVLSSEGYPEIGCVDDGATCRL
ncbi:filamentous hemagglutinin N-terminal domain-containing protein [Stutzerimonas kirkiae]|uniref:two-partner secretion domain-containing protein n=1 Tax=Stutzerimonas kirkiae TaxID=2211392 RepID=UPI001038449E|nr:filamentous hemagglutinin N-terminal domain-containing protein [Stutzerimonas kirkiae]TBV17453.1 hypothetical protein DNK01_00935 [Stutzerimonas kirkiae]